MLHTLMSPMKCKNAIFVAVLSLLFLALCLAVSFGQRKFQPGCNVDGYCELAEAVIVKKIGLLKLEIEALEERVTVLEEENEPTRR